MTLILHDCHLRPLVLLNRVLLDRVESLFAGEAAEHKHIALTHGDGVSIPGLVHGALDGYVVLVGQVDAGVFLWWGATTRNQDLSRRESNGG